MLRISGAEDRDRLTEGTLRLEGEVTGPWVGELRRVCFELLGNNRNRQSHLVLDVAGVSFLDADGIALFRELSEQHVLFTNGSAFIAEQLRGVADVDRKRSHSRP